MVLIGAGWVSTVCMVFGEVTNYLDMFIMVSCRFSDRQRIVLAIVQLLSIKKK
jgi:hypothetical protein